MSNKSGNLFKTKLIKKLSSFESSILPNSLYSGITNARNIQKSRPSYSLDSTRSKRMNERRVTFAFKNPDPPICYHPWELEYNQVFTRENMKKPMIKDPYTPRTRSIARAKVNITTEEECHPVLIPTNAVHIQKPIVYQGRKSLLSGIVRYVPGNELMASERFVPRTPIKQPSVSRLQSETKAPIPLLGTNEISSIVPTLATNDSLLHRVMMRNDASVIRRPPRRLIMNATHKTIVPLTIYD